MPESTNYAVNRPAGDVEKWSKDQTARYIRRCVKCPQGGHFFIADPHGYERMEERDCDVTEVLEVVTKGTFTDWEPPERPQYSGMRLTFVLQKRTSKRKVIMLVSNEFDGCMLITVI